MKKIDRQVFESILVVLLSLAIFLIILAGYIKIDEHNRLSYKLDTKFETSDMITITNKLPISDEIGKSYNGTGMEKEIEGYSVFTISNPNDKKVTYEIYLTRSASDVKQIKSSYVKLYLTDGNNNPLEGFDNNVVKSFYDLYALNDKPGSRLLYRSTLVSGGSKKFILRSWVSDTYILSKYTEDFGFDIDVRIK